MLPPVREPDTRLRELRATFATGVAVILAGLRHPVKRSFHEGITGVLPLPGLCLVDVPRHRVRERDYTAACIQCADIFRMPARQNAGYFPLFSLSQIVTVRQGADSSTSTLASFAIPNPFTSSWSSYSSVSPAGTRRFRGESIHKRIGRPGMMRRILFPATRTRAFANPVRLCT
jgi:hypothetical protein